MTQTRFESPIDAADTAAQRIQRAEAAIAGLKASFAVWARADLQAIDDHFANAAAAGDGASRDASLEELRRIAHNLKGQGGTFGCDGLSAVAAELDALLKNRRDETALEPAKALISVLWAAFAREAA